MISERHLQSQRTNSVYIIFSDAEGLGIAEGLMKPFGELISKLFWSCCSVKDSSGGNMAQAIAE
jgi:hypothetical protein